MDFGLRRGVDARLECHLLFFSGMLAVACVAYVPYTPGPIIPDIPAVVIPLGVSIGLVLFAIRTQQGRYETGQIHQIVGYAWFGLLVSAGIGGWWLASPLFTGVPIGGVLDKILTVVSLGIGTGVVVGNLQTQIQRGESASEPDPLEQHHRQPAARDRLLEETCWTGSQRKTPIFSEIVDTLAELEDVDQTELEPIYKYVNPAVFSELREQERSQWQLHFYTETYEIRVSSLGTVSVYDADPPGEPSRNVLV